MAGGLLLPMEPPRRAASQQQLQFSLKAPSVAENLSARFASPLPIVIEKLKKPPEEAALCGGDSGGLAPLSFSAVSEETLRRAVRLARRDLKRRPKPEEEEAGLPGHPRSKALGKAGPVRVSSRSQRETTGSGAKVYISKATRVKAEPLLPDSPPTRDPGLVPFATKAEARKEKDEEERSAQEVRRLQKELQGYIRKVEALAQKERSQTSLDPEERRRARIWGQEQAARSARTLYMLRQQVKEIQDDLEKLGPHQVRHTKKSRAMARLAAAHRGASRALQNWLSHWTLDQPEDEEEEDHRLGLRWAHCRELGQLLRQLSLCSVQMEAQGPPSASSPPDALLDLMLQIEDLDSLLARKAPLGGRTADPPPAGPPPKGRPSLRCPRKEKAVQKRPASRKLPPSLTPGPPSQPLPVDEPPEMGEPPESGEGVAEEPPKAPPKARPVVTRPKGPALLLSRLQGGPCKRKSFREPTLSFRLKEAKPPLKGEGRPPWMPPSTASPPRSTAQVKAPEKKVEQAVLEPLLQRVQKATFSLEKEPQEVGSGRQPGTLNWEEGPKGGGDPREGPPWQQDKQEEGMDTRPDLVEMLQRMQEIERSQEAVRRRYHRLVYSDVEFCAQEKKNWGLSEGPPPPIQVTQALSRKEEPQVDIVLERPSDTNAVEEEEEEEEAVHPCTGANGPPMGPNAAFLSVPQNVLQSIADYGARYRRHLRLMAHEAVGRFDPWRIAESLAEELTESALEEVAAELQGLCEDYAEALFVSEFLQPPMANP